LNLKGFCLIIFHFSVHPHISNAYTHVLEGVSTTFSRIDKYET